MPLDLKDVISFYITEHLTKFNTQKKRKLILNVELLYDQDSLYFLLTLYLRLTSTKNVNDLAGTRRLKTKSRVKLQ